MVEWSGIHGLASIHNLRCITVETIRQFPNTCLLCRLDESTVTVLIWPISRPFLCQISHIRLKANTVGVILRHNFSLLVDLVADRWGFIIIGDELTTLQKSKRKAAKGLDGVMINRSDRHREREREFRQRLRARTLPHLTLSPPPNPPC